MSVEEKISHRVKYMQKGRPFSSRVFAQVGSRASVNKALSRLVRSSLLERVARGVYMRPKLTKYTGTVRPSPLAVMEVITKANGETIQIHGCEAVRRLGLSTQMQVLPTFYTSGSTREIKVGNAVVRLKHVSWDRLQHAGTKVGVALTALRYTGKEGASVKIVRKIINVLSREELTMLCACKMPEWMRSALNLAAKETLKKTSRSDEIPASHESNG
jgi:hypothetical protein